MKTKEYEKKMMLTEREYRFLIRLFENSIVEKNTQINYYYDTRNETMRKMNITVRIREKNGKLLGTVKDHGAGQHCSTEECFRVDTLPRVIMLEGLPLWLKGTLKTERSVFRICDGILLMLDLNTYLDVVDYELEIEYSESFCKQTEGILMLIANLLGQSVINNVISKSERFFRRFVTIGGSMNV